MINSAILSVAYLPPIQYFTKLVHFKDLRIESMDNYIKQTYRNRCIILSANGPLSLTIPVIKTQGNHTPIKQIEIDNSTLWQKNHWKSIESAYRTSAYFDFVADLLQPFYTNRFTNLYEYDIQLMNSLLEFISLKPNISPTTSFLVGYPSGISDFRNTISPKNDFKNDNSFIPIQYFQVFSNKMDFIPNLSIIDLLFNEGLSSIDILMESQK